MAKNGKSRKKDQKEKKNKEKNIKVSRNTKDNRGSKDASDTREQVKSFRNTTHLLSETMTAQVAHGRQVSSLAYEVGREMGLSDDDCRDLIIAGFLHDIGKTVLDAQKETDQTLIVEEMNALRSHPAMGYEILKRHGYSEEICCAVRWHHENVDGSGYPDHLTEGRIPLKACILRVCDVFCALVQDRPYRPAHTQEQAIAIMISEVEKYDLKVFLAFQRVMHRSPDGSLGMPPVRPEVEAVWKTL